MKNILLSVMAVTYLCQGCSHESAQSSTKSDSVTPNGYQCEGQSGYIVTYSSLFNGNFAVRKKSGSNFKIVAQMIGNPIQIVATNKGKTVAIPLRDGFSDANYSINFPDVFLSAVDQKTAFGTKLVVESIDGNKTTVDLACEAYWEPAW